jgi:hypothetical protein
MVRIRCPGLLPSINSLLAAACLVPLAEGPLPSGLIAQSGPRMLAVHDAGAMPVHLASRDDRFALLVGISDYPGEEYDLGGGPLNDVMLMKDLLVNTFGFAEENILTLTDEAATKANIARAFRTHLAQAGSDGVAVFYFSGHGTQVPNEEGGDTELDSLDEAVVTRGSAPESVALIRDDELGSLVEWLGNSRALVLLDNCYSGTGTRGAARPLKWRDVAGDLPLPTDLKTTPGISHARVSKRITKEAATRLFRDTAFDATLPSRAGSGPVTHILISASAENEVSLNVPLVTGDGTEVSVGLLTAALYRELHNVDIHKTTFAALVTSMRSTTRSVAARMHEAPQTPQVEGAQQGRTLGAYLGAP